MSRALELEEAPNERPGASPEAPAASPPARDQSGGPPLRILLPSYRSNPTTGGQGVYMRHISRALVDLGHHEIGRAHV